MGGGIEAGGPTTIINSTIAGNNGFNGGGIDASGGDNPLTITNSTITGNTANNGGGIATGSCGATADVITNSTITHNTAGQGGGIYGCVPTLVNSVVTGNSPDDIKHF